MKLLPSTAKAWIGREYGSQTVSVGRGDIAQYAFALGLDDPIHFDPAVAINQGYPDVVAPATFCIGVRLLAQNLVPNGDLREDGTAAQSMPEVPLGRLVNGETSVEVLGTICAGDVIDVKRVLIDVYEKRGRSGPLVFLVFEITQVNQRAELVAKETHTSVLR